MKRRSKDGSVHRVSVPHLAYAAAVAKTGSFSAAAKECGVSQPTVSNGVSDLEEALGVHLFARSTRAVTKTPAGEALLPLAHAVLDAVSSLDREAKALRNPARKLLRIAFSQLLGAQRLALLFEPFARQNPGVELIYKECAQGEMEQRLEASTVDVVCGVGLVAGKNRSRQLLFQEALRWIPPGASPTKDRVDLREAARSRLVLTDGSCGLMPATRELFARARIAIEEYAGRALSYAALEEWADLGIGGAILPSSHIRRAKSAALEQHGKPIFLAYEAVWRRDLLVAEHARAFSKYVRAVVPHLARAMPSAQQR